MALSRREKEDGMSFIQHWGRISGIKEITVTPGSELPERGVQKLKGIVKSNAVDFEVTEQVFEGDVLEWEDRGRTVRVHATSVEVFDQARASSFMKHISVKYSKSAPASSARASHGATVINVNGSQNVNIGLGGSTITQQVSVSPGYEKLADAVGKALAVIEDTAGVDPDEVEAARESVTLVVKEVAKPAPDEKAIKRALTVVKGVLTSAASAGAGVLASGLIEQLVLGG